MKRSKSISGLLILLLAASALIACGDEAMDPKETGNVGTGAVTETTAEFESEDVLFTQTLEPVDFGGAEFRVSTSNTLVESYTLPTVQNFATEENGEVINDTLYQRDVWLEESYNVDVQMTDDWKVRWDAYMRQVQSGDYPYDLIINDVGDRCSNLARNNLLIPLNMLDTIQLDAHYWFPELNEQLNIGEDSYFVACPISPRYYTSAYVIMFNRELAETLDLPDLYDSVKNGTWTIDQMAQCAKAAFRDVDGNGKYDENDIWGMTYEQMTPEAMVLGAGMHYIVRDGDSMRMTLEDENVVNFIGRITEMFQAEYTLVDGITALDTSKIYASGNYMFWNPVVFTLYQYRDYTYDYGILPMPKQDEKQDGYYVYAQPFANATAMVPMTVPEERFDMVGTLTDAMTAYGYDYLRPAVYENVVKLKGARDEQSAEIIDLMFENVTFELAALLNPGPFYYDTWSYFLGKLGSQDFTSHYAARKSATEAGLKDVMEAFREHHEMLTETLG